MVEQTVQVIQQSGWDKDVPNNHILRAKKEELRLNHLKLGRMD